MKTTWIKAVRLGTLFALFACSAIARAADVSFSLLIDSDQAFATGCSVAAPDGAIGGVDLRINVFVRTTQTTAIVLSSEQQACSAGSFAAPTTLGATPWNVGLGNGTSGSGVVEFSLPLSLLPSTGSVRAWVIANNGSATVDQTGAFSIALAVPTQTPEPVPLSPWLAAFIAVAIAAWGMRSAHRSKMLMTLAGVVLGASFIVWAATIVRDGTIGDWVGVTPAITDGRGESSAIDIVSVFTQTDATQLHARIDAFIALEPPPTPTNTAPVVTAGSAQTLNVASLPASASLSGTASDDGKPTPPGALTLAWSKVSGPGTVTFTNAASATTSASFDAAGVYVLRLTANDGALTSTSDVTITIDLIIPSNAAPIVNAGANQTLASGPGNVTLNGTASDDGRPSPAMLTTTWTLVSGPVTDVTFANPNATATTAVLPVVGTYVLRLSASDGALTSTATTAITVLDAAPQMANIPNRTIPVGVNFKQALAGVDSNPQDTFTFSLSTAPAGATLAPNQVFDWTPSNTQLGPHAITVKVTDRNGNTDSKSFTLTVVAQNRAPVLAAQADATVAQGAIFIRTLTATDPDGDAPLNYVLVNGPAGMTLSGAILAWPVGTSAPGTVRATVQVRDPSGLTDTKIFALNVTASAPPVARNDEYSVVLGQTLTVPTAQSVLANDVPASGLTATKLADPDKGTLTAFNADGSFTYFAPSTPGARAFSPQLVKEHQITDNSANDSVVLADLNGDGHADMIFNHLCLAVRGCLTAFDIKNNATLWTTSASTDGCMIGWSQAPWSMAVGDLDDDGVPDVVMYGHCGVLNSIYSRILAFNARTGALKWKSESILAGGSDSVGAGLASNSMLTIARLRTGEKPSVLVGRAVAGRPVGAGPGECATIVESVPDGYWVVDAHPPHYYSCAGVIVLAGDTGRVTQRFIQDAGNFATEGSNLWRGKSDTGFMFPAIALDFDDSGENKVMMNGAIWNLDGTKFGASKPSHIHAFAVGNFDDTPDIEIAFIEQKPTGLALIVKKANGQRLWSMPLPTINLGHLTVADIDGDGQPEILLSMVLGPNEFVWALDRRGRVLWTHTLPCGSVCAGFTFFKRQVAAFDLDGDGVAEVITPYSNEIRFLDGVTGKLKASLPTRNLRGPSSSYSTVARVADVDSDGSADVVLVSSGDYFCVINPTCFANVMVFSDAAKQWRPTRKIVNQYAYFGANVNDDATIPSTVPLPNTFATAAGNVFASQPQTLRPVDPRIREVASFTYTANAGTQSSAPATVNITLSPANRPPRFTSQPPTRHNDTLTYQPTAVDPDVGDTLTYAIDTQVNASGIPCVITASTGLLTCTPLDASDAVILISVTDSLGEKAWQTVLVKPSTGNCVVPNVAGLTQAAASSAIAGAGCSVGEITEAESSTPIGQVVAVFPNAGTSQLGGETVHLTVSKGPPPVAVPFVVGLTESVARTRITSAGLAMPVTRTFSNTIPAGTVISQATAAGTLLVPGVGNVSVTISAGSGLTLRLNRAAMLANETLVATPEAFDVNGAPTTLPGLTYTITEVIAGLIGPLPTISGTTISASPTTFGAYRITAIDTANSRSASAEFVVTSVPAADEASSFTDYARMSQVLESIYALRPQLVAARAANDMAAMTALVRQIVNTWRTINLENLRLAKSIEPFEKFPLTVAEMRALGHTLTAQDLAMNSVLKQAVIDLRAWTKALNRDGASLAELDMLADRFNAAIAGTQGLTISRFGGIVNEREYTLLLSHLIPEFYESFFNEVGQTVGLAPRGKPFPQEKNSPVLAKSTLSEQLVTVAVDKIVEKVMEQVNERVRNTKQFVTDIYTQAAWTAGAVAAARELKDFVKGVDIVEVVSGASLSFRVFNEPTPNWATIEVPDTMDEPGLWSVMVVGPDLIADASGSVRTLFDELKSAVSLGIDPLNNPKKFKSRKAQRKWEKDMREAIQTAQGAATNLQDIIAASYQSPDEVLSGCVFTSDPNCAQLYYEDGFVPAYRYTPPSGFAGFSGLPVPIIFIVQNQITGQMYIGTPVFLPAPKTDP